MSKWAKVLEVPLSGYYSWGGKRASPQGRASVATNIPVAPLPIASTSVSITIAMTPPLFDAVISESKAVFEGKFYVPHSEINCGLLTGQVGKALLQSLKRPALCVDTVGCIYSKTSFPRLFLIPLRRSKLCHILPMTNHTPYTLSASVHVVVRRAASLGVSLRRMEWVKRGGAVLVWRVRTVMPSSVTWLR